MQIIEFIHGFHKNTNDKLVQTPEELDRAINHIVNLLEDVCHLYSIASYPTSAFLSITACEEVAKAHIGIFTDGKHPEKVGRNVFHEHNTKHRMAALPTVAMGKRLEKALGKKELERIMNMAQNGGFVQVRENSLYFHRNDGQLVLPAECVDAKLARSLALFAIEVFDDALVGFTNHSYEMDDITDRLFEQVSNS